MEDVCKKTGVRDQQLNQEISESVFAEKFPHVLSVHKVGSTLTCIHTVDSRYSGSLKYGHLDIPAIWLGTEC